MGAERAALLLWASLAASACSAAAPEGPAPQPVAPLSAPAADLPPVMRRLTAPQYARALRDLLGSDFALAVSLDPDRRVGGLLAVGASESAPSRWGVERYEDAALAAARWVSSEPTRRAELAPCAREAAGLDRGCLRAVAASFGRRAWRRPLTEAQLDRLTAVGESARAAYGEPVAGLTYLVSAVLQSPYFLYRVEVGEPDPARPGKRRYTSHEMAARLAFLFAGSTPDADLLARADRGELLDEASVREAVAALLTQPAARRAVRDLFADTLELDRLDAVTKDPVGYRHARPDLWVSAREETERTVEALVFGGGDYRDLYRSRQTFVDRRLAALYGMPAPAQDGFAAASFPEDQPRRGILGQASFLGLNAHPLSSSATLRGKFVREILLCQTVPPPPSNVDTSLPEPSASSPTLRERVQAHAENPTCAACHRLMDPIGLGFELFDGVGRYRRTENGARIDASGELDGVRFEDPRALADAIAAHPDLARCMVRTAFRFAEGRVEGPEDAELLETLTQRFDAEGRQLARLLADIAASATFRSAGDEATR